MFLGAQKNPLINGSFEYPQHIFWLINKKNNFQVCTLILGPGLTGYTRVKHEKGFALFLKSK